MFIDGLSLKEIEQELERSSLPRRQKILSALLNDNRKGSQKLYERAHNKTNKAEKEKEFCERLLTLERRLYKKDYRMIAGADESGRGCLAGPLVAASVILPKNTTIKGLRDSKQLSPQKRKSLYLIILDKALSYRVESVSNVIIDTDGLHQANLNALKQSINNLSIKPDFALIDGYSLSNLDISCLRVIKGDIVSASISAASIIAKVHRDRIMEAYHQIYPQYGFNNHKGYGSKKHFFAIKEHGLTNIHRKSFNLEDGYYETQHKR